MIGQWIMFLISLDPTLHFRVMHHMHHHRQRADDNSHDVLCMCAYYYENEFSQNKRSNSNPYRDSLRVI